MVQVPVAISVVFGSLTDTTTCLESYVPCCVIDTEVITPFVKVGVITANTSPLYGVIDTTDIVGVDV